MGVLTDMSLTFALCEKLKEANPNILFCFGPMLVNPKSPKLPKLSQKVDESPINLGRGRSW